MSKKDSKRKNKQKFGISKGFSDTKRIFLKAANEVKLSCQKIRKLAISAVPMDESMFDKNGVSEDLRKDMVFELASVNEKISPITSPHKDVVNALQEASPR